MDFTLTEEETSIQEMMRAFSNEVVRHVAKEIDKNHRFPDEIIKQLAEMGILGINMPQEYGGAGMSHVAYTIVIEEIARWCASTAVILSAHLSLASEPINKFGSEEQKKRFLPDMTSGARLGCFALSEPQSGSDARNIHVTAVQKKDKWIINGSKNFITNGREAQICVLICRGERDGKKNPVAIVIDRAESPFVSNKPEDKMGIRGSSTTALTFADCEVPVCNTLGKMGAGFKVAMETLDGGRIGVAAQALGIAQGAMELAIRYAKERMAFGQKVADFQGIQWYSAEMLMKTETSRLLIRRASWLKGNGSDYATDAAMAKNFASEAAAYVVTKAVQIHGGYGFTTDYDVERMYRDQRITEIYEGTSEIQRQVIAKHALRAY